jgi:predicted enzyme related to lactoylglutathione lyase
MGQPVVHFEIMGNDALKLHKFYAELFNWKLGEATAEMGYYALIEAASSGLPGGIGQTPDGNSLVTLYVQVPDLQATLDQAVAKGGIQDAPDRNPRHRDPGPVHRPRRQRDRPDQRLTTRTPSRIPSRIGSGA